MVERKMERSCQACGATSAGRGTRKRTARPAASEARSGSGFAPPAAAAGCGFGLAA
uniref:PDCT2 n=1 Tax=Arundo donax TaxID=35708 RepID=A0A0A9EZ49_ARUDO